MSLSEPSTSGNGGSSGYGSKIRKMVFSVYNFFRKYSSEEMRKNLNFSKCQALTAEACSLSVSIVSRVCREVKRAQTQGADKLFHSPRKHINVPKRVTNLDDFQKDVVRRTIFYFYDNGKFPTADKLTVLLRKKINYSGSVSSTKRLLNRLGFRYRKTIDGRKYLMERNDIVAARLKFLRKMHMIRSSGDTRPTFYLDETWVNKNHSLKYVWQDSNRNGGLKVPLGKGGRLIVCHVGSAETGFVPGSKWVFRSKKTSDYHEEMTAQSFRDWFLNRFLNHLEEGSIIIMDNAPYHSVSINRTPNTSSKKDEISEWLKNKGVSFSPSETKSELLEKVLPFKSSEKMYELDQLANEMGHEVIRLPRYHCQYSAIELIWAQVKREVARNNKTLKCRMWKNL